MARFVANTKRVRILKARGKSGKRPTFATNKALNQKMQNAVRASYTRGITSFKSGVSEQSIYEAVKKAYYSGKYDAVTKTVPWDDLEGHMEGYQKSLLDAAGASAKQAHKALPADVRPNVIMGTKNPIISDFIDTRTTGMIKTIADGGRAIIKREVRNAVDNRVPLNKVAARIRDSIGLNDRQATALTNMREREVQKGTSPAKIDKLADAYNERLLDDRAQMIARTEMRVASSHGQLAVWQQGINDGDLPDNSTKVWIVDGAPCDICEPMDGIEVPVGEPWTLPNGLEVMLVSESHPACVCGMSINMNPQSSDTSAADIAPTDNEEESIDG